jgi:hypothetical protein
MSSEIRFSTFQAAKFKRLNPISMWLHRSMAARLRTDLHYAWKLKIGGERKRYQEIAMDAHK